ASAPFQRVLTGTSAAPADCAPRAATIQPSPLGAQIATRSPGCTPAAIIARVAVATSSPSSRYVTRRPGSTTASASGRAAMLAATAAGIVSSSVGGWGLAMLVPALGERSGGPKAQVLPISTREIIVAFGNEPVMPELRYPW